ncbi:MAG TPA: hypothetical protein DCK76_09335 [Desulfotomaculum sp.]|nr:MAG: hypothetical protein XD84_0021 [Desulfotomaculum sp. 46_80]HAG11566.1 hypothetical protein [Desulfotomaculum sp.]HBY03730.1 hypothetical protein [Desulfotomaculum sp.]
MSDLMDIINSLIDFFQAHELYIFLCLGLIVLITGIVLTIVQRNIARAEKDQKETNNQAKLKNLQDLHRFGDEREIPGELLTKVNKLMELGELIINTLARIENNQAKTLDNYPEESLLTLDERIYQAYKKGQGISELAVEFGRPKGEVELILNLYKSKIRKDG